jgi:ribosomal-protein-alanine N-acetyltransferase
MKIGFTPFPILTTDRLHLRELRETDAAEIFLLRSDDVVNRYLDRVKSETIEDAKDFILKIANAVKEDQSIMWGIVYGNEATLAGTICLWNLSKEHERAEIGYELLPSYHGKGIMQEAVSAVIDFGFKQMELRSIEAALHPHNIKSIRLLEKNHFIINTNPDQQEEHLIVYSLERE